MKSHTTAVKERDPGDKNRALDTQAPITMGEDDDEQTGNCIRYPPMNSSQEKHEDKQDKPKYKRQEFMRPKYGAVSFDVIDAVNARLAAAANGENGPSNDFFNRVRYDVSVENPGNTVDAVIDLSGKRPTLIEPTQNGDAYVRGTMTAPGTPAGHRASRPPVQNQGSNEQRNSKSNRSIT
uniref:Uncharacterized protein n=1 Tax=Panagrolaimus sp. JU765 TaxID=591449 RepID=A0AC34RRU7_9BILA